MSRVYINDDDLKGLEDKVIIITGGSAGIGRATAQLCLNMGAIVVIGDLNEPAEEFENSEKLKFLTVNASQWESLRNMFEQTVEWFGRVDHVFANAGITATMGFLDVKLDEEGKLLPPPSRVLDLNLTGSIYTAHLTSAYMTKLAPQTTSGSLVLACSGSGFTRFKGVDYAVSKHGVLGMVRGLVEQFQDRNLRVNAIAPSWTTTAIIPPELFEMYKIKAQSPEAVARSVVLLFCDQERHGDVLYSWDGKYKEINKGPAGLLGRATELVRTDE